MFRTFIISLILFGLYLTTFVDYLLFHSLVEIFSIVVAISFFMITWNSKKIIKNQYLLFIGTAYLFIAFIDLLHTLTYKGMPIFTDYDYYSTQLWIGARYLESITLAMAFYFLKKDKPISAEALLLIYTLLTALLIMSIFVWKVFPVCFIETTGLTAFKKTSEYLICMILLLAIGLLYNNRKRFDPYVYRWILLSIIFSIISELAFTFYVSVYGVSNLVGHYLKLFSFYLIYKSIVETGIKQPYELIFRELDETVQDLNIEIDVRKKLERDREQIIVKLQNALTEVKILSGLIPICAHCKKIRDDKGFWNQLEEYITKHSEAQLSHGICPDCLKKHYSEYNLSEEE